MKSNILKIVAFCFIGVGFIGFLGTFILAYGGITLDKELPLSTVEGIVIDSDENIYVGLMFYGRIQAYNAKGEYSHHWQVDAGGGTFKMKLEDDQIVVITARGDKHLNYDFNGKLLSERKCQHEFSYYKDINPNSFTSQNNDTYTLEGFFCSRITKNDKEIFSQGILISLLKPYLSWFYCVIGIYITVSLKKGSWKIWKHKLMN